MDQQSEQDQILFETKQAWNNIQSCAIRFKAALDFRMPFDYLSAVKKGPTLLVGEGDLSFTKSLLSKSSIKFGAVTTSTFEAETKLSQEARRNALVCKKLGASVLHGIDATKLGTYFGKGSFRNLIFQFPNVGSRDPKYGRNPNHHLVKRFLKSSTDILQPHGLVVISTVNSPYYDGSFNMLEAAEWAMFGKPEVFPFFPSDYPGYNHVNTLVPELSAIDDNDYFQTFVFKQNTPCI